MCAAISELDDRRPGLLVDVGCGSAAHRRPVLQPGRAVVGFDISFALLGYAKRRLGAVAVSDGCRLPLANGCADAVNLTFVLSDVDEPSAVLREAARILRPSGQLVLVGPHPCFNGPSFERTADGTYVVHPTYFRSGWSTTAPGFGQGVRSRVGFHHRTLSQVLNDVITAGLNVARVVEYGADPPFLLGVVATSERGRRLVEGGPATVTETRRRPGQGPYARPERERRFLLAGPPPGVAQPWEIVDRYIDGTSLRLRQAIGTGPPVYKLGQKVRLDVDDPSTVMLTNIYLEPWEYERLLTLPATRLAKTRYSLSVGEDLLAVDVFHGELAGLVLA
jgi:SAM-dependent methyltransferase